MRFFIQRSVKNTYFTIFHIALIVGLIWHSSVHAQYPSLDWGLYHREEPLLSGHPGDYFHATGELMPFSGIGDFSQIKSALPKTLFHLYAHNDDVTNLMNHPPAILRLQSGIATHNKRAKHLSSSIEFRVGAIHHPFILEEQVGTIENVEIYSHDKAIKDPFQLQRGLQFSVQKQGMLGTEKDGMLKVLHLYSQKRTIADSHSEWLPRVGIGNERPLETLHLGNTFTLHAGGANRIADNLYYDVEENCDKKIVPGFSSSISMHRGNIILSNSGLSGLGTISHAWGDASTLNGIAIDHQFGMSIGKMHPQATLDMLTRSSDARHNALTIENSNHSILMNLTSHGSLGIYNAKPKDRVHIGERLTLHAGGASIIGDNIYFDSIPKAIETGQSASLIFTKGNIQLANTSPVQANAQCSYQLNAVDEQSIRGIMIESNHGFCGIGTNQPRARLDVLAQSQDTNFPAFSIGTKSNEKYFTVTGKGHIGIGIEYPKHPLQVNGNVLIGNAWNDAPECDISGKRLIVDGAIITKEILVTTDSWADDVFESEYKLISIDSLERYITMHKHLPNMPTEHDIKSNGIHLANLNVALVRKIEELTLYVIDLKKDIQAMHKVMDTLPIHD